MKKTKMKKSTMPILSFFILALSFVGMTFAGTKINSANANDGVSYLSERVVTATAAGTVLKGDKVVIVNTNLDSSKKQSVGTFNYVSPLNETNTSGQTVSEPKAINTIKNSNSSPKASKQGTTTYAVNDTAILNRDIPSTCIAVGEHCYVFAKTSELDHPYYTQKGGLKVFGKAYADKYDTFSYPYILKASGVTSDSDIPYRGTDKMCILLELESDGSASGYYISNSTPSTVVLCDTSTPESQSDLLIHEVNHFLDDVFGQGGAGDLTEGLATTLQMHARQSMSGVDAWINGLGSNAYLRMGMPIFTISRDYGTDINYSYNYLFLRYLVTQKLGSFWHEDVPEFLALLHSESYAGRMPDDLIDAMEYMVNNYDANEDSDSLSDTITSFFVATVAHEETGKYGFYGDPQMKASIPSYPSFYGNSNHQIPGRSCIVVETVNGEFTIPSDCGKDIRFFAVTNEEVKDLGPLGSNTNPILIYSKDDLNQLQLNNSYDKYFKLANDIDLGNEEYVINFGIKGNLDGDGHTIKGKLYVGGATMSIVKNIVFDINRVQYSNSFNIFDYFSGANVENIHIINSHPDYPVALVGHLIQSNISRCSVIQDANITSSTHSSFGYIVSGEGSYGGSTIENCLVAGNLNLASGTYNNVGGFIPKSGTDFGEFLIKRSVSALNINSNSSQGNIGLIMGDSNTTGRSDIVLQDAYYLTGTKNPVGLGNSDGCRGVSSLTNQSNFSALNFNFLWKMGVSYPVLQTNEEIVDGVTITASIPNSTHLGAEPNLTNATITLSRNGSSFSVPMTIDMLDLSNYSDITSLGNNTLIGSYLGDSFEAPINIVALPEDIELSTSSPVIALDLDKEWVEGSTFNGVGNFKLTYTYKGNTYTLLYNFATSLDGEVLSLGTKQVTFYAGNDSYVYTIEVKENGLESIDILSTNVSYYSLPNEPLVLDNLVIEIVKENGDSFMIGPEDLSDYGFDIIFEIDYLPNKRYYYDYGTNLNIPSLTYGGIDYGWNKNIAIVLYNEEYQLVANVGNLEYGYAVEMDITADNEYLSSYYALSLTGFRHSSWEEIVEKGYQVEGEINFFGEPGTDYTKPFAYMSDPAGYENIYNGYNSYFNGFSGWTIEYNENTRTYYLSTVEQKVYAPYRIVNVGYDTYSSVYSYISSQLLDVNSLSERFASPEEALEFLKDELMSAAYSYQNDGVTQLATIKDIVISRATYDPADDTKNIVYFSTTFNEPSKDSYTLKYEWTNAPDSVTLPTNNNTYQMYSNRTQNFDTTFTKDYEVEYNNATYTFSGWTETISSATTEGVVITLKGDWTKVVDHEHEYHSLITTAPTCSNTGIKTYTCSICDDTYTEELPIDANKHTCGELIPEVPATTTTEGTKEHKTCSGCGKHFDKDGNELTSLVIEKKSSNGSSGLIITVVLVSLGSLAALAFVVLKFGKNLKLFKK